MKAIWACLALAALAGCGSSAPESTAGDHGLQAVAACLKQAGFQTTVKAVNAPPGYFALGSIAFTKSTPGSGGTVALFNNTKRSHATVVLKVRVHPKVRQDHIGPDYVTWNTSKPDHDADAAVRSCVA